MTKIEPITEQEWEARGTALFGSNKRLWKFVCPSCGTVTAVQEWIDAESPNSIAFSCIGRFTDGKATLGQKGKGPCNYAGGGLFRLNPVHVQFEDGIGSFFDFAPLGNPQP